MSLNNPNEESLKPKYTDEWKNNMIDGFGLMVFV